MLGGGVAVEYASQLAMGRGGVEVHSPQSPLTSSHWGTSSSERNLTSLIYLPVPGSPWPEGWGPLV